MIKPLFFIQIIVLLLLGCTPHRQPPLHPIAVDLKTRNGTPIIESTHRLQKAPWWQKMHDPHLNHIVDTALLCNNQIAASIANIQQAHANLNAARFAWLPTLNAHGQTFVGGGFDTSITPHGILAQSHALSGISNPKFNGYYTGFMPNYSLNILHNIKQTDYAKASLVFQKAAAEATRLSIISQTTGGYFMLLGQKKLLQQENKLLHDLTELRQLEYARYQDGASDLSQVANLDQQIQAQQAQKKSIEDSVNQLENALQVLMNKNPGSIATQKNIASLSTKGLVPAYIPSAVLKNRPDMIMAEANLRMSAANIGIAYSNFFPNISLTGFLGSASLELAHLLSFSTGLWTAQATASIPILNGQNYEQIIAAKAAYQAAFFNYRDTLHNAFADVDNKLTTLEKTSQAYHYQIQAYEAAQKNLALAQARYKTGAKDYRDVLNAKYNMDEAYYQSILAKMDELDSLVGVYQALAGTSNVT